MHGSLIILIMAIEDIITVIHEFCILYGFHDLHDQTLNQIVICHGSEI